MLLCYFEEFCYHVILLQSIPYYRRATMLRLLKLLLLCYYALRSSELFPRLVDDMLNHIITISICIGSQPNSCGGGDEDSDSQC